MADRYLLNEDKAKGSCVSFKAHKDLDRGMFLEIIGMANSILTEVGGADFELYKVKDADANTKLGNLLVNISVPKDYDERLTEKDFYVKTGDAGRGRNPKTHCVHTYNAALVDTGVVAGDKLKLGAGKLSKIAATGEEGLTIAIVEEVLTWKGQASVRVRYL